MGRCPDLLRYRIGFGIGSNLVLGQSYNLFKIMSPGLKLRGGQRGQLAVFDQVYSLVAVPFQQSSVPRRHRHAGVPFHEHGRGKYVVRRNAALFGYKCGNRMCYAVF